MLDQFLLPVAVGSAHNSNYCYGTRQDVDEYTGQCHEVLTEP